MIKTAPLSVASKTRAADCTSATFIPSNLSRGTRIELSKMLLSQIDRSDMSSKVTSMPNGKASAGSLVRLTLAALPEPPVSRREKAYGSPGLFNSLSGSTTARRFSAWYSIRSRFPSSKATSISPPVPFQETAIYSGEPG